MAHNTSMRNHHLYRSFKSEQSPSRQRTAADATLHASMVQQEKKFFDIEYIFDDPIAKRRRYQAEPTTPISRTQRNYRTLEPKADMTTSVVLKIDDDSLLKMQPVREKQLLHLQKTDLHFNRDSKRNSIHARRMTNNSSILRNHSARKTDRAATVQAKPFQAFLSSKNCSFNREARSAEKEKRRSRVEKQIRKLEMNDALQVSRAKKISKIEGEEFRKYCERNIELAKNAFLLKNKQTIRIYRPWSPINLEEGFLEYDFGEPL